MASELPKKCLRDLSDCEPYAQIESDCEFAERLKQARINKGMSQGDLAVAMNLTQGSISHFEKGLRLPTPANIDKFVEVLGISREDLVGTVEADVETERVRKDDLQMLLHFLLIH